LFYVNTNQQDNQCQDKVLYLAFLVVVLVVMAMVLAEEEGLPVAAPLVLASL
jgi:hypothetical protein